MIRIVNKHNHIPTNNDIYVGRGSPLGNPFSHLKGTKAEFVVTTRNEAIDNYEIWINNKINKHDPEICNALNNIWLKAKQEDINLCCYCFPKKCHAEIIKKLIEEKL